MLHTHMVLFFQNLDSALPFATFNVDESLMVQTPQDWYYVRALEKELDTNLGKYEAFVKKLWDTKSIFLNIDSGINNIKF